MSQVLRKGHISSLKGQVRLRLARIAVLYCHVYDISTGTMARCDMCSLLSGTSFGGSPSMRGKSIRRLGCLQESYVCLLAHMLR